MKDVYRSDRDYFLKLNSKKKKWRVLISCLALFVAIGTVCALMLPADTQEQRVAVYQVNTYKDSKTTLVYGGSVQDKLGSGMSFKYWDAVFVEKDTDGRLYISKVVTAEVSKLSYKASTSDGFVLLLYDFTPDFTLEAGQIVTVDFNYKSTSGTSTSGFGNVVFSTKTRDDPAKDNTELLTVVEGADTKELIEVNLYNYGTNINDKYNSDKKYPGFQQDNGTKSNYTTFSAFGFNFGNNITEDLAAGQTGVTKNNGLNGTVDKANKPVSGAMLGTLKDGYPALSDGTSLSYLFEDNTYAEKKNKTSINGLFIQDPVTGAYSFNSRKNHAQFNAADDTFTLYEQMITPNFMMYPFGNFMPFNDIVHHSQKLTLVTKDYLKSTADNALAKYNSGYGNEYNTLSTVLTNFLSLMDSSYTKGWSHLDCMNEYFKAAGLDRTFEPDKSEFDKELTDKLFTIDYDVPKNFYFGMEMKMNFIQPKDGLTGNDGKQPLIFYFTGDDDVWVYLDGVLFLDLSGIHRHVGGEIDFVNGTVKYFELDPATGEVSDTPYKTVRFSELVDTSKLNENGTFKDYSTHTFNFYYMERGAGSGVCRMNFNFPLLRENSISVAKELDTEGVGEPLGDPDFSFQIMKADGTGLFIGPNSPYDILDSAGKKLGEGRTDENGVFKIKAGQIALFNYIDENSGSYFVRELLDNNTFGQYGQIVIDGTSTTTDYGVTVGQDEFHGIQSPTKDISDGSTVFRFNNVVSFEKLGKLQIHKTLNDLNSGADPPTFSFAVTLDGKPIPTGTPYKVGDEERYALEGGIITLASDETAVIDGILAGSVFNVRETDASSAGYTVRYECDGVAQAVDYASGVIITESTVAVNVINTELGITVQIPLEKQLRDPDGDEHSYTFILQEAVGESGEVKTDAPVERELTLTIKDTPVTGQFEIGYSLRSLDQLPKTFYYRITEVEDPSDTVTAYDRSVYVVAVEVTEGADGQPTAAVKKLLCNGTDVTDSIGSVTFANQIVTYALPSTGGHGAFMYIAGGLILTASSLLLLYKKSKG